MMTADEIQAEIDRCKQDIERFERYVDTMRRIGDRHGVTDAENDMRCFEAKIKALEMVLEEARKHIGSLARSANTSTSWEPVPRWVTQDGADAMTAARPSTGRHTSRHSASEAARHRPLTAVSAAGLKPLSAETVPLPEIHPRKTA